MSFALCAQCLYALNNFSSLMAFIAGWNTSSVIRLKWTMKDLPKKTIEVRSPLVRSFSLFLNCD
jgi:hypothetical protein